MNKTFLILITLFSITTSLSQDISGTWNGKLGIDQEQLNIRFNIQKTTDGYTSTCCNNCLVSSEKVNSISYENSILKIKFDDLEYEGVYRSDNVIVGNLIKSGESFPMELSFSYYELYENGMQKNWFEEQPISVSEGSSKFGNSQKMISVQQKTYTSKSKTYSGNNLINYIVSEKMSGVYHTFYGNDTNFSTDTIGKYVNGKRDGLWMKKYRGVSDINLFEFIYDNGKLLKEISFSYNGATGKNYKWSESYFTNGVKTNTVFYSGGDKISSEEFYEKDRIVKSTLYFENGNIDEYYDNNKYERYDINGDKFTFIDLTTNQGFRLYKDGQKWEGVMDRRIGPNGYGTYSFPGGEKFIGFYNSRDNFFGKGQYLWADGRKYEGNFKKGDLDGYGKMTYPDGSIKEGIWENGNLINDYNKTPIASNSKTKTSVAKKSKKGSLPAGFYSWSTKEQIEWYNTDEGTAWLMNSQLMKDVAKEMTKKSNKCDWCNKKIIGKGVNYEVRDGVCWISDIYINSFGFKVFCSREHANKHCNSRN
jgi:hypothetical protein